MYNQIATNASLYSWVKDMLFETYAGYNIIDFKSNSDLNKRKKRWNWQLGLGVA